MRSELDGKVPFPSIDIADNVFMGTVVLGADKAEWGIAEEEHYETSNVQCCFIQHSIWLISQCYINWITFRIFRVDFAITKDGIRQMTKVKTEVQNSSEEFTTKANMSVSIKSKILIEAKRLMLILSATYLKI